MTLFSDSIDIWFLELLFPFTREPEKTEKAKETIKFTK